MDQHKLRSLVFEKTGVRVDIDDPIFALVALNEAVLAETVERHVALIESASRELASHARAAGGLAPMTAAAVGAAAASRLTGAGDETAAVFGEAPAAAPHAAAGAGAGAAAPASPPGAAPVTPMTYSPTPAAPVRAIATQSPAITPRELRLLAAAAGISILSSLLVLAGQALFSKPVAPPAPIVQAKTLTPEQTQAIATGEKLARAIQKLDPKTRSQLQAELQK
jgi:hypothetical protein